MMYMRKTSGLAFLMEASSLPLNIVVVVTVRVNFYLFYLRYAEFRCFQTKKTQMFQCELMLVLFNECLSRITHLRKEERDFKTSNSVNLLDCYFLFLFFQRLLVATCYYKYTPSRNHGFVFKKIKNCWSTFSRICISNGGFLELCWSHDVFICCCMFIYFVISS